MTMRILFIFITLIMPLCSIAAEDTYRVLRVIDGDTFYLDFNHDGHIQKDERVRLNGIDTFEVKPSSGLEWQMKTYNLTQEEALGVAYMAKEFAKERLLGKDVKAVYSGETKTCTLGRHLMSVYYKDEKGIYKNYEEEILKSGLAVVYGKSNLASDLGKHENLSKLKRNARLSRDFNLVIVDKYSKKYYNPTCIYAHGKGIYELIDLKSDDKGYESAVCPGDL